MKKAVRTLENKRKINGKALFDALHSDLHGPNCACDPRADMAGWSRWRSFVTRHVAKAIRRDASQDDAPCFDFDSMRMYELAELEQISCARVLFELAM